MITLMILLSLVALFLVVLFLLPIIALPLLDIVVGVLIVVGVICLIKKIFD